MTFALFRRPKCSACGSRRVGLFCGHCGTDRAGNAPPGPAQLAAQELSIYNPFGDGPSIVRRFDVQDCPDELMALGARGIPAEGSTHPKFPAYVASRPEATKNMVTSLGMARSWDKSWTVRVYYRRPK